MVWMPHFSDLGGANVQRGMVTDPVCGLEVDPREAPYSSTYEGRTYYFSDPECKRMFDEDPEAYVGSQMAGRRGRMSGSEPRGSMGE
jgi:YHS domain-containing protein